MLAGNRAFTNMEILFHENTLTLIVTDGTKGMFELSGAVSDRNVRFADMIFDGAFR